MKSREPVQSSSQVRVLYEYAYKAPIPNVIKIEFLEGEYGLVVNEN
jgi:hypothetical protein